MAMLCPGSTTVPTSCNDSADDFGTGLTTASSAGGGVTRRRAVRLCDGPCSERVQITVFSSGSDRVGSAGERSDAVERGDVGDETGPGTGRIPQSDTTTIEAAAETVPTFNSFRSREGEIIAGTTDHSRKESLGKLKHGRADPSGFFGSPNRQTLNPTDAVVAFDPQAAAPGIIGQQVGQTSAILFVADGLPKHQVDL